MKIHFLTIGIMLVALPAWTQRSAQENKALPAKRGLTDLRLTVLYDNVPFDKKLQTQWGFACLVQGAEKTILFDTGGDGGILLSNMKEAGFSPGTVDAVVLSHFHQDHTGGLSAFLDQRPGLPVYLLPSFPEAVQRLAAKGAAVPVDSPVQICRFVHSSGRVDGVVKEQALVVETRKGLVVITGCAHPGIVEMVRRIRSLFDQNILLVMGGFHLSGKGNEELVQTARDLQSAGVSCIGPSHCSGEKAMKVFEEVYKERYIAVGAGKTIGLDDLP
jgi:7,8-dihydropterin-6-yl-methyl-4-(beta-D-ribofuranosyl)aminobenzene 5'-phosphate synthase